MPLEAPLTSGVPEPIVELVLLDVLTALELVPPDDVADVLLDVAPLVLVLVAPVELAIVVADEVLVPPVPLVPPVLLVAPLVADELSVEPDVVFSEVPDVLPQPVNARAPNRANTGARRPRRNGVRREGATRRPPERRAKECMWKTGSGQTSPGQGPVGMRQL